jgi:tetratricopeptide (TPR) repeat protein
VLDGRDGRDLDVGAGRSAVLWSPRFEVSKGDLPENADPLESASRTQADANDLRTIATSRASSGTEPTRVVGPALERGQAIGRFVILGKLGSGGMGEVYAAYDPDLDRKIAVKVMREKLAGADGGAPLLLREAQAAAKLQHPNVVVVYEIGTFFDRLFIAMELVEGQTADDWIASHRPSWREVLDVFIAAGRGLAAAHAASLVHRDFKPENVMITHDGQVRVMDFGLARSVGAAADPEAPAPDLTSTPSMAYLDANLTRTGAHVGTPAYMAPEQFLPGEPVDARTDQFNFCVALYEGLYGERPFGRGDIAAIQLRAATGKVQPAPANSRVPLWVRRAVLRGLRPKREERWPSMAELLAALSDDPSVRRRRWAARAAGVSLLAVAILTARGLGGGKRPALCSSGASRLAGIWEPSAGPTPRREAIHRAFLASGTPFAETAFVGASRLLDQFAERWIGGYGDACEATHVRGEQSAEVLDLRMACLGERLGNLRALTDVLAHADATVVENAVSAAGALPNLDRCSDVSALRAVIPPPQDPSKRREVARVRDDLARFIALRDSGQCKAADAKAAPLIASADATDYDPLRGEVLIATGLLGDMCGDIAVAIERLKAGYGAAFAGHDDRNVAVSTTFISPMMERVGQTEQAHDWIGIGRAALKRLGSGGVLQAWLLLASGMVKRADHDYAGAIDDLRKSILIEERLLGTEHPDLVHSMATLGDALEGAEQHEQALATDREALARARRLFGAGHPMCALISMNMGEALNGLRRFAEAREAFQAAIDIWQRSGADASFVAYGLTGIGRAWLGEQHPGTAIAPLEKALAIRIETHGAAELVGETRFALAQALWSRADARPRAIALATTARAERAADKSAAAEIDAWLLAARGSGPKRGSL